MPTFYGQLKDVNTTDIAGAIRFGCQTMQNVFDADDNDVPFFGSIVRPEARLSFNAAHSESHVPGRHLNALLNAEDAIGIELEEAAVRKHAKAAYFSFSGALPFPLNRQTVDGPLVNFLSHNLREGMHALYALVKYRQDDRARELAEACIDSILELWTPAEGWDIGSLRNRYGVELVEPNFTYGIPRLIGPLVKYYRVTSSTAALDLALLIKERVLMDTFVADGEYTHVHGTHTHSTTCIMSSLAQLAELANDASLLARVKTFYDNGLKEISNPFGWVIENSSKDQDEGVVDRGEVNNTGDIVETALILGRFGYTRYFEDAERILRCHLLPSQLRDIDFIEEPENPENVDGLHDVAGRHLGAFGFPAPYGHEPIGCREVKFNMDIVGGAVGSLCEAYRSVFRFDETGHHVNLLFDHETDAIAIESPYTRGVCAITLRKPGALWVRIPSWAAAPSISGSRIVGDYLFVRDLPVGQKLELPYELASRELVLRHRTRDIRVQLRGDSVEAMENFGADLTYFPAIS
jgi:hypothetical protein